MKVNIFKKVVVATLIAALAWTGVANATTVDEVKSITDKVALKAIADDANEVADVRFSAMTKLPADQVVTYLNADWLVAVPRMRAYVIWTASSRGVITADQYPVLLPSYVAAGNSSIGRIQDNYIKQLLKEGNTAKALSESKRLLGVTDIKENTLLRAVNSIGGAIKGDAITKGASAKDAIAAMNAYLEAINNKDVSGLAFTALPYPAADPAITALETDDNLRVSAVALLYNGKYTEATAKGNDLLVAATNSKEVEYAMWVIGAAANGAAGLPTAANDALGAQ